MEEIPNALTVNWDQTSMKYVVRKLIAGLDNWATLLCYSRVQ